MFSGICDFSLPWAYPSDSQCGLQRVLSLLRMVFERPQALTLFHNTGLQLLLDRVVVEIPANDHQLVFTGSFPIGVVD